MSVRLYPYLLHLPGYPHLPYVDYLDKNIAHCFNGIVFDCVLRQLRLDSRLPEGAGDCNRLHAGHLG
ncbi:hypothetical protein D3C81_1987750 [compost metagenome]